MKKVNFENVNSVNQVEFTRRLGEVDELEEVISLIDSWIFQSPFNPLFFKICTLEKLRKRLYQKKYRLKI